MEIRKMSQSELDKAIKDELERAGGYAAWRRNSYTNEVASKPPKLGRLARVSSISMRANWWQFIAVYRSSNFSSKSLGVTSSTASSCSKNKFSGQEFCPRGRGYPIGAVLAVNWSAGAGRGPVLP